MEQELITIPPEAPDARAEKDRSGTRFEALLRRMDSDAPNERVSAARQVRAEFDAGAFSLILALNFPEIAPDSLLAQAFHTLGYSQSWDKLGQAIDRVHEVLGPQAFSHIADAILDSQKADAEREQLKDENSSLGAQMQDILRENARLRVQVPERGGEAQTLSSTLSSTLPSLPRILAEILALNVALLGGRRAISRSF